MDAWLSPCRAGASLAARLAIPKSRQAERPPYKTRGETAAHLELKRLALLWAQENGYPIAALEVSLPQCRYRADVAAYRPQRNGTLGHTAVFECKQSAPDLRRDDCRSRADARASRIALSPPADSRETSAHPLPDSSHRRDAFPRVGCARFRRDRASRLQARHARVGRLAKRSCATAANSKNSPATLRQSLLPRPA